MIFQHMNSFCAQHFQSVTFSDLQNSSMTSLNLMAPHFPGAISEAVPGSSSSRTDHCWDTLDFIFDKLIQVRAVPPSKGAMVPASVLQAGKTALHTHVSRTSVWDWTRKHLWQEVKDAYKPNASKSTLCATTASQSSPIHASWKQRLLGQLHLPASGSGTPASLKGSHQTPVEKHCFTVLNVLHRLPEEDRETVQETILKISSE